MTRAPDVLVIVGDCIGKTGFDNARLAGHGLPTLDKLAKAGISFEGAISPSSWTLPAHASIFTGLYPWNIRMLNSLSTLPAGTKTVATEALSSGYRTASFSSNPFISPRTGLTQGFSTVKWGSFIEETLRMPFVRSQGSPPKGKAPATGVRQVGTTLPDQLVKLGHSIIETYPSALDMSIRCWTRLHADRAIPNPCVSPWIEAHVESWLRNIPQDSPAFCFVNYMDAHEPYVGVECGSAVTLSSLNRMRAIRLSVSRSKRTDRPRADPALDGLKSLYEQSIRTVDSRIGVILDLFSRYRDSSNCWICFLGDHGQVFGEDGNLFHGSGGTESLFRVPLIIKPPRSQELWDPASTLVSLKDLGNLLFRAVTSTTRDPPGFDIQSCFVPRENRLIWALADIGTFAHEGKSHGLRLDRASTHHLLAFADKDRFVIDPSAKCITIVKSSQSVDGGAARGVPVEYERWLREEAGNVSRALDAESGVDHADALERRLLAWGYD